MEVTLKKICEAEPEVLKLHRLAKKIGDGGNGYFCANEIWYNILKPRLYYLVGWGRKHLRGLADKWGFKLSDGLQVFEAAQLIKHLEKPENVAADVIAYGCGISPHRALTHTWLETSRVYNVASEAIYSQLPNCRDCSCAGVGR